MDLGNTATEKRRISCLIPDKHVYPRHEDVSVLRKPWSIIVVHFCSRKLVLFPTSYFCFPRVIFGFRELFLVSAS